MSCPTPQLDDTNEELIVSETLSKWKSQKIEKTRYDRSCEIGAGDASISGSSMHFVPFRAIPPALLYHLGLGNGPRTLTHLQFMGLVFVVTIIIVEFRHHIWSAGRHKNTDVYISERLASDKPVVRQHFTGRTDSALDVRFALIFLLIVDRQAAGPYLVVEWRACKSCNIPKEVATIHKHVSNRTHMVSSSLHLATLTQLLTSRTCSVVGFVILQMVERLQTRFCVVGTINCNAVVFVVVGTCCSCKTFFYLFVLRLFLYVPFCV